MVSSEGRNDILRQIAAVLILCRNAALGVSLRCGLERTAPRWRITLVAQQQEALALAISRQYCAIVIVSSDVAGPSPASLCERLRLADENCAILVLGSHFELPERVSVVQAGGDEFVPYPESSFEELQARICVAAHRRRFQIAKPKPEGVPQFASLAGFLCDSSAEVNLNGVRVPLTLHQWRLLKCLVAHKGRVVPAGTLSREAGLQDTAGHANLHNEVSRLRKRLSATPALRVITVRGHGYRLELVPRFV